MDFDGVDAKDYGLVPISTTGAFDMPKRMDPYFYDWGDTIEPLLGPSHSAWLPREIIVDFLYDQRVQTIGVWSEGYVDGLVSSFSGGEEMELTVSNAVGAFGVFTVKIKQITTHKKYRNGKNHKLTFVFKEVAPQFLGTVPVSKLGGNISIDGYGVQQFGANVVKISNLSTTGALKESSITTYLSDKKLSAYRSLKSFSCQMVIHDADPITKLFSFQKVLTSENVMPFVYGGISFDVIFADGFNVKFLDSSTIKFNLELIRL